MNGQNHDIEVLQDALRRAADLPAQKDHREGVESDLIWRVVVGEASAQEARELADRAAQDPTIAEAWRIALEIQRERQAAPVAEVVPFSRSRVRYMALAAAVVICVSLGTLVHLRSERTAVLRGARDNAVHSLLESPASLPRDAFELRWTAGGDRATYDLLVTTDKLDTIVHPTALEGTVFLVPADQLAAVEPGAVLFWQVTTSSADGEVLFSDTFTVTIKD